MTLAIIGGKKLCMHNKPALFLRIHKFQGLFNELTGVF